MRRDLHAGHEHPPLDDLAVERREHLKRVDAVEALQFGDSNVQDTTRGGHQIDPTLRGASPLQVRSGHSVGQAQRSVILVQIACLRDEHHPNLTVERPKPIQIARGQPATLGPALAVHDEVAGQHGALEVFPRPSARFEVLEVHAQSGSVRLSVRPTGPARPRLRAARGLPPWPCGTRDRRGCRC